VADVPTALYHSTPKKLEMKTYVRVLRTPGHSVTVRLGFASIPLKFVLHISFVHLCMLHSVTLSYSVEY
jgi:hypothetical protein